MQGKNSFYLGFSNFKRYKSYIITHSLNGFGNLGKMVETNIISKLDKNATGNKEDGNEIGLKAPTTSFPLALDLSKNRLG